MWRVEGRAGFRGVKGARRHDIRALGLISQGSELLDGCWGLGLTSTKRTFMAGFEGSGFRHLRVGNFGILEFGIVVPQRDGLLGPRAHVRFQVQLLFERGFTRRINHVTLGVGLCQNVSQSQEHTDRLR